MRPRLGFLVLALVVVGCRQAADPSAKADPKPGKESARAAAPSDPRPPTPAPPAKPRDAAPLLLSDGGSITARPLQDGPEGIKRPLRPPRGPVADNSRCYVCHVNYEEERLTIGHARAQIGCEKCHGPSDEHCGDEGNVTAPTILFAKAKVDESCKVCHPEDRATDAGTCLEVVMDPNKRCADCHGQHRMAQRTVHWDPVTHKLIPSSGKPP